MTTESDQYLKSVLAKYSHTQQTKSSIDNIAGSLMPIIQSWGKHYISGINYSGSLAKGTSVLGGTDVDLFISLNAQTPNTMKEIYDTLFTAIQQNRLLPRKQNVSVGLNLNGLKLDLVPAKQQDGRSSDHSLYKNKGDTWTKTNVQQHINLISQSGRTEEIRVLKIWRNQQGFSFPSFYLELSVLEALNGKRLGALSDNVVASLEYLKNTFISRRVIDPANSNNIISDDLTQNEKSIIVNKAASALGKSWGEFAS